MKHTFLLKKKVNLKTPNVDDLKNMTLEEIQDAKMFFVLSQDFETASECRDWERKITGWKPPKALRPQKFLTKRDKKMLHELGYIKIPITISLNWKPFPYIKIKTQQP